MSPAAFRRLVLSLPETIEGEHMGHPDFRVNGRIFASLYRPRGRRMYSGMVKLTIEQQRACIRSHGSVFQPCVGAWGRQGATEIRLKAIDTLTARSAIQKAWRNVVSKSKSRSAD